MSLLLNWRLWVLAALLALVPILYLKGRSDGKNNVRKEWMASVAAANEDARRLETLRQSRVDEAAKLAAARDARIRADAVSARRESDGLRDDLNAANEYAKKSRAAAERIAGVASDLFGRCTARYTGVAEAAQRADSEARELRQGWPK